MAKAPVEADTRYIIDKKLESLNWYLHGGGRNVYFENPRSETENKKLQGKHPDYILYSSERDLNHPIAIIEAKRPGRDLNEALEQGLGYAKKLNSPIVFATDGVFYKTIHQKTNQALLLNGEELDELIRESLALQYLDKHEVSTVPREVQISRVDLINIFTEANDDLRKVGLRAGIERFNEFSNLLFLKLLSDIEALKDEQGFKSEIPKFARWSNFREIKDNDELLENLNKVVLPKLNKLYGENSVLPKELGINNGKIVRSIVDKLDPLILTAINMDVKGDSFEHFLKATTSTKNDLGEYFTPRHIVKTMTCLINPQFGETVYDPFCGTGGMLIQAFKHIYDNMSKSELNDPEHLKRLKKYSIYGSEITNTARIAKMNMILSGDGHSNITQTDSLNPDKVSKKHGEYDAIISNIPYSQQTEYGQRYPIPNNNGDSICVQHCINALKKGGRMALVVPEGFMFRKDLKKTREWLFDNCDVQTIVSLPHGVFLPYTGVKTNIMYCKNVHKPVKPNNVFFFEVINDGYSLDSKRIKLTEIKSDIKDFESKCSITNEEHVNLIGGFDIIPRAEIKRKGFTLINSFYQNRDSECDLNFVELGDLIKLTRGFSYKSVYLSPIDFGIPMYNLKSIQKGYKYVPSFKYIKKDTEIKDRYMVKEGDLLVAITDLTPTSEIIARSIIVKEEGAFSMDLAKINVISNSVLKQYLHIIFHAESFLKEARRFSTGTNVKHLDLDNYLFLKIPVPPVKEQIKLIEELGEKDKEIIEKEQEIINIKENVNKSLNRLWVDK